jgi:hypothetical protein
MPATNLCPYCQQAMAVSRMTCHECGISIEAAFPTVLASGNLKQIAEQAGVSYPTVRSRLDKVIDSLRQEIARTQQVRGTILDAVSEGKLDAEEAARVIKAV